MSADLPPTSGYTYAAEISADEALTAGAKTVRFSEPISYFVEDLPNMPVGAFIPVGVFDYDRSAWVAERDGIVIEVLDSAETVAAIDLDGDGIEESATELEAEGLDEDQRIELAELYPNGAKLWFVQMNHLSPWDFNYANFSPPASPPPFLFRSDVKPDDPCLQSGSIIECENQILRESIAVEGTGHSLHYASGRAPGYSAQRRLHIPLTTSTPLPVEVSGIEATIEVAGRRFSTSQTCPCGTNQYWDVVWDGKDRFGRFVQGAQLATYKTSYIVPAFVAQPAYRASSFAQYGRVVSEIYRGTRAETKSGTLMLPAWDARAQGLGGFSMDVVHSLDIEGGVLYRGDGSREADRETRPVIKRVHSHPYNGFSLVTALADGGIAWFDTSGSPRIMKRSSTGVTTTVAGTTSPPCVAALNRPALNACIGTPRVMSESLDGSLYITSDIAGGASSGKVLRIRPDGWLENVAGTGVLGFSGDEGPALLAQIAPKSLAMGPDGALYLGERGRIRRVGPDGRISTILGDGTVGHSGDDGLASAARVYVVTDMVFGRDGTLFFIDYDDSSVDKSLVRKIEPSGFVRRIGGRISGGVLADYRSNGIVATQAIFRRAVSIATEPDPVRSQSVCPAV